MIDDVAKVLRLVAELEALLPLEARPTPPLARLLSAATPGRAAPARCRIASLHYAGDAGGILCGLDIPEADRHLVSITHLDFDRRTPLYREITAYQRHRVKKLRAAARQR